MYDLPSPQYLVIRLRKDPVRKSDSMTYRICNDSIVIIQLSIENKGGPP